MVFYDGNNFTLGTYHLRHDAPVSVRVAEVGNVIDFLVPEFGELWRQGLTMIDDMVSSKVRNPLLSFWAGSGRDDSQPGEFCQLNSY